MYFVTVVTRDRSCLFGHVADAVVQLSDAGRLVRNSWEWLTVQYSYVTLDEYVVMPNHMHGIIAITDLCRSGSQTARPSNRRKPLGRLIGAFKTVAAKRVNLARRAPGAPIWQRNYYEHII